MSDSPVRVLQVLRNMNCGGAETLVINLHKHIDRNLVQFDYLLFWPEPCYYEPTIRELGGTIHRLPYLTDVGLFQWLRELGSFFTSHPEYQIVHSHLNTVSGPILMMAKRAGVPIRIAHSHNTHPRYPLHQRLIKAFFRLLVVPSATHRMACSQPAGAWLFGPNRMATGTHLLRNAIDLEAFSYRCPEALLQELAFEGKHIIGHVGGFRAQKNHAFLIGLMPDLVERNPDVQLVLVGDGPLRPDMERRVAQMGLQDHVRFLGLRSDITELMSMFDVFAFPSLFEGLGIVLIEAQATGLRCVVSDAVPVEADIGVGLIDFVSLDDREAWIGKLLQASGPRQDTHAAIRERGYEIRETARWLQRFYTTCHETLDEQR